MNEQKSILQSSITLDLHAVFSKYGCTQPFVSISTRWGGESLHIMAAGIIPIDQDSVDDATEERGDTSIDSIGE